MLRLCHSTVQCYSHQFIISPQGPVYWPVARVSTDRDFIDFFFPIKDNLKFNNIKGSTEYHITFWFLFPCIMFVVQCNVELINLLFYSFSDSYCFLNGFELSRNSKRKN